MHLSSDIHATSLEQATLELVRQHRITAKAFTERQIADAIRQAILAGDFTRLVVADSSNRQAVIYMPYQGVEDLRSENRELRAQLAYYKSIYDNAVCVDTPCCNASAE